MSRLTIARSAICSLIVTLGVGCAFKGPGSSPEAFQADGGTQITLDWSPGGNPNPDPKLKAVRTLTASVSGWTTHIPVTLPARPPEAFTLSITLPGDSISDPVSFVRSAFQSNTQNLSLVTQVLRSERNELGRSLIALQVSGLDAALGEHHSADGTLAIELFSASRRITSVQLQIRTPPSEIEIQNYGLESWQTLSPFVGESFKRLSIQGSRLSLVKIIQFKQNETTPVELTFPQRTGGQLQQWTNPMSYRDLGCAGDGYAVDSSPRWDPISTDLLYLPLDEALVTSAMEALLDTTTHGVQHITVPAGETRRLGIYAVGEAAARWSRSGPEKPALQAISVPSQCYRVCAERECDCTVHCGAGAQEFLNGLLRPNEPAPLSCICTRYESGRRAATITVGVDRGPIKLELPVASTLMTARFSDLDPHEDGEFRSLSFTAEQADVSWQ